MFFGDKEATQAPVINPDDYEDDMVGVLSYDKGWTRREKLKFFGDDYGVTIRFLSHGGLPITDNQKDMYNGYAEFIETNGEKILKEIISYMKNSIYPITWRFRVVPQEVVFSKGSSWGIVFYIYDKSEMIHVLIQQDEINVVSG